jgi:hypothetical protein
MFRFDPVEEEISEDISLKNEKPVIGMRAVNVVQNDGDISNYKMQILKDDGNGWRDIDLVFLLNGVYYPWETFSFLADGLGKDKTLHS